MSYERILQQDRSLVILLFCLEIILIVTTEIQHCCLWNPGLKEMFDPIMVKQINTSQLFECVLFVFRL